MKVYITGNIRGLSMEEAIERIKKVEAELLKEGHQVLNPKITLEYTVFRGLFIHLNLLKLIGCDAIYMMSGWEDSFHAILDKEIAEMAGKEIMFEEDSILSKIKAAIHGVMGISYSSVKSKSRKKWVVYAKVLFVKLAHESGTGIDEISKLISRSPGNVLYSLKKYDDDMKYTPEFKQISDSVRARLSKIFFK